MSNLPCIALVLSIAAAATTLASTTAELLAARSTDLPLAREDMLHFRNGDTLQGSLVRIDDESGVQWNRPDAVQPFAFNPEFLTEIRLSGSPPISGWTNNCTLQLVNGDQLQGQLLGYDGQKVTLSTWYAGELSLPAESVAVILPLSGPGSVTYSGPTGIEDWTIGRVNAAQLLDAGEWSYSKGAFYSSKAASIARDVDLPDVASIQFDLEWRGFFNIAVALYTEYLHPVSLAAKDNEPDFGGFYSIQINPFSANLLPVKQNEPLRYLGQAPLQHLAQKTSARFDLRVNKATRSIALLVDGQLMKQWVDNDSFAGSGTAIRFVHQGQGIVKLSNIKVSEWDGQFEEPPSLTANKSVDLARLRNGDRIAGPVRQIVDERMQIEAAGTTLNIPISRVTQVELAAATPKPLVPTPATVRAHFASSGTLTFELKEWTSQGLVAESDNFGTVTFRPGAFNRIVFDLLADAREAAETPSQRAPVFRFIE